MRFDDMIATVLERPSTRPEERAAQWRQLVDLLAQQREGDTGPENARAYAFLRSHRAEVDMRARERTAAALSGLRVSPDLISYFGEDHPAVSSPLLRGARLGADDWITLLPSLSPTGRAILRHRRDLPAAVVQALAAFGPSDFVIGTSAVQSLGENDPAPAAPIEPVQPAAAALPAREPGRSQIRELVDRIEAFQKHRDAVRIAEPADAVEAFRWETGSEGLILWVDGAPRGPLVGQSIAAIAEQGQHGVDGQAAGAFHKRAPFRDARFTVPGEGGASGDWRISGVPYFDVNRGNFLGYRGTARRPRLEEVAALPSVAAVEGLFGTNLPPDSLRQLIHELRTPLNAIIGFAEMIEGQYMGPAGSRHRGRANEILGQARRLLSAVDDLDTAARLETDRPGDGRSSVDAAALLVRLHDAYQAEQGRPRIAIDAAPDLPPAAIDASAAERMLARMLAATIGLAAPDETIAATLRLADAGGRAMLCLRIDRPAAIAGLDEMALLHPGYSPDGDWPGAPALGLGFALRLVRKLAEAAGGSLDVEDLRFALYLPAVTGAASQAEGPDRNGGTTA